MSHYDTNLDKNAANYVPLTPISFLERAKDVYPNYEAIVYEDRKYTWAEVYKRTTKFASASFVISMPRSVNNDFTTGVISETKSEASWRIFSSG